MTHKKCFETIENIVTINEGFLQNKHQIGSNEILLNTIGTDSALKGHVHNQSQFGCCFKGIFILHYNDKKQVFQKQNCYVLHGDIPHSAEITEGIYSIDVKFLGNAGEDMNEIELFSLPAASRDASLLFQRENLLIFSLCSKADYNFKDILKEDYNTYFVIAEGNVYYGEGSENDLTSFEMMKIYKIEKEFQIKSLFDEAYTIMIIQIKKK